MMKGNDGKQGGPVFVQVAEAAHKAGGAPGQQSMGAQGKPTAPADTGQPKEPPAAASPEKKPSCCTVFCNALRENAKKCCNACMDGCGECAAFA